MEAYSMDLRRRDSRTRKPAPYATEGTFAATEATTRNGRGASGGSTTVATGGVDMHRPAPPSRSDRARLCSVDRFWRRAYHVAAVGPPDRSRDSLGHRQDRHLSCPLTMSKRGRSMSLNAKSSTGTHRSTVGRHTRPLAILREERAAGWHDVHLRADRCRVAGLDRFARTHCPGAFGLPERRLPRPPAGSCRPQTHRTG